MLCIDLYCGLGGWAEGFLSEGWVGHNPVNGQKLPEGHGTSNAQKAASAQIAKIPFPLSQHIARVFKPDKSRRAETSVQHEDH